MKKYHFLLEIKGLDWDILIHVYDRDEESAFKYAETKYSDYHFKVKKINE